MPGFSDTLLGARRYPDGRYRPPTPKWLGIDEIRVAGKLESDTDRRGQRALVDILQGRTTVQVGHWLSRMPNRERVEGVTIDMRRPYRDPVRKYVP